MKSRTIPIFIAAVVLLSCNPKSNVLEDFKKSAMVEGRDAFKRLYNASLDEASVKVMTLADLDKWIASGPYKDGGLPCEINEVIQNARRGNVDPSPIALDVSGSSPDKAQTLVYIPIRDKVSCPSPKAGFFVGSKGCGDKAVLVCNGRKGAGGADRCPSCQCVLACDAVATDCDCD